MDNIQILYNYNAMRCKDLGSEIEELNKVFCYHKHAFHLECLSELEESIRNKRIELSLLWDKQVDLFFVIKSENELIKCI
ncbi:hypothetical protein TH53_19890 [Pedobacter lusitanus]|uniref:Uncharacterized protein n=1 Tax=Pedobacter lusitanus TaxID=1503925 RepID=A0A0D0GE33_9SPHI|nr:hypothetical protein TH53_19890 [Pedobacter lusitanus]